MCLHPRVSEVQALHSEDPREVCSRGRQMKLCACTLLGAVFIYFLALLPEKL